jgi:predicted amidohydrolase
MSKYQALAKEHGVWLSLGGFHEKIDGHGEKIANTHVVISGADGSIVDTYRKIHLFDVNYDGGYKESNSTIRGDRVVVVENTPIGTVGLSTCYDLRFPRMYEILRDQGASVLLIPSAFMVTTGRAHWEVLLRARAIESQCYVIASAQVGKHNEDITKPGDRLRESYGHSLVVDPFGAVIADLGTEHPALQIVDLNCEQQAEVQARMPVKEHRHATASILRNFEK